MIPVDFHAHTLFSGCGIHTHIEMLTRARDLGMSALALTDHGRECGGRIPSTFFDRLRNPVPGIRMLKGIEANLRGLDGEIDVPPMALGSDAHALNEVGRDEHARALLQSESFPAHLLVNHTAEQAYAFIEERRARKKRADG